MNENTLQETLDATKDFAERQQLLRQLWKLRSAREAENLVSKTG